MRIALATCAGVPPQFDDDELLAAVIRSRGGEARLVEWDDPRAHSPTPCSPRPEAERVPEGGNTTG